MHTVLVVLNSGCLVMLVVMVIVGVSLGGSMLMSSLT